MAISPRETETTGPDGLPELRLVLPLACDASRLWRMVTEPGVLGAWLGTTILSDAQFGGFTVATDRSTEHTGIITACDPPHYYQATWDNPPHPSGRITVDVTPNGSGSLLGLTHGGVSRDLLAGYESFWSTCLDRLTRYAAGRPSDPDDTLPPQQQLPRSAGGS